MVAQDHLILEGAFKLWATKVWHSVALLTTTPSWQISHTEQKTDLEF